MAKIKYVNQANIRVNKKPDRKISDRTKVKETEPFTSMNLDGDYDDVSKEIAPTGSTEKK